jgi:peroxiredoxin
MVDAGWRSAVSWTYRVLGLAAAAMIVFQAAVVRDLRAVAREFDRFRTFPFVGQWTPTIRATALDGTPTILGETLPGRVQVLFYFTTTCPYCAENLGDWKALAARLEADSLRRFDVHWVSLSEPDSTRRYVAEHGISGSVVIPPGWKEILVSRVKGVPMTLVLDHQGRVAHAHPSLFRTRLAVDSVIAAASAVAERTQAHLAGVLDASR